MRDDMKAIETLVRDELLQTRRAVGNALPPVVREDAHVESASPQSRRKRAITRDQLSGDERSVSVRKAQRLRCDWRRHLPNLRAVQRKRRTENAGDQDDRLSHPRILSAV